MHILLQSSLHLLINKYYLRKSKIKRKMIMVPFENVAFKMKFNLNNNMISNSMSVI